MVKRGGEPWGEVIVTSRLCTIRCLNLGAVLIAVVAVGTPTMIDDRARLVNIDAEDPQQCFRAEDVTNFLGCPGYRPGEPIASLGEVCERTWSE